MATQGYDLGRIYESYQWYCRMVSVKPLGFNDWTRMSEKAKANGSDFILEYRKPRRVIASKRAQE